MKYVIWRLFYCTCFIFQLKRTLPYSHYYHSGVIGSGTCVFSQTTLTDVHCQQFTLNGYPHKIMHADWWGGKGVSIFRTTLHGIPLLIANTHVSYTSK